MPRGIRKHNGPLLVEQYRSRGAEVTRREFCRAKQISTSTLDYWLAKARREAELDDKTPLIPVMIDGAPERGALAVVLANGRRIEAVGEFADADFVRLTGSTWVA